MSSWIKADNRLVDADKAYLIEYSPADPTAPSLRLHFGGVRQGSALVILEGEDAEAAWKAIQSLFEQHGAMSDLKYFKKG